MPITSSPELPYVFSHCTSTGTVCKQGGHVECQKLSSVSRPRWSRLYSHVCPSRSYSAKLSSLLPTSTHDGTGVIATATTDRPESGERLSAPDPPFGNSGSS